MKSFESVNKLINEKVSFPRKALIKYDNQEFEIIAGDIKISLGDVFYFSSEIGEILVTKEENFSMLKINQLTLLSLQVDCSNILRIQCEECLILGFPREYEGWGIYKNSKQLAAHNGWQSDLDWE